jgi:predicted O-methyltransferase YrrM
MEKATYYVNELASEMALLFVQKSYEGNSSKMYDIVDKEFVFTKNAQKDYEDIIERVESLLQSMNVVKEDNVSVDYVFTSNSKGEEILDIEIMAKEFELKLMKLDREIVVTHVTYSVWR